MRAMWYDRHGPPHDVVQRGEMPTSDAAPEIGGSTRGRVSVHAQLDEQLRPLADREDCCCTWLNPTIPAANRPSVAATTTPRRRTQNDTARRSTRYDIIARMRHDGCGGGASAGLTFRTKRKAGGVAGRSDQCGERRDWQPKPRKDDRCLAIIL